MVMRSVSSSAGLARLQQHQLDDLAAGRAHGLRRLDLRLRHAPHVLGHHQHHLEEGADEDDGDLGRLVDADPQHHQRDEGHRRHVADEIGQRLEQRLHRAEGADQQPSGSATAPQTASPR